MAVLRFRNDQPGNERTQRQRDTAERGEPRNAETGDDDRQQEQLTAAAADDMSQQLGDQIPGRCNDEQDNKNRLPQGEQNRQPYSKTKTR